MSRKMSSTSARLPFHIYARSNNKDWFYLPIDEMWSICVEQLFNVTLAYGMRSHAFILMNNHFHLLASTPDANLGSNMNYLMREISREVNRRARRINHVFGGTYKAALIQDPYHYFNAYRYVYQNPLRAGICRRVEDYKFSSLSILFGQTHFSLPLYPSVFDSNNFLYQDTDRFFYWLNQLPSKFNDKLIMAGLKKTTFALPVDRHTRISMELSQQNRDEIDALLNQK